MSSFPYHRPAIFHSPLESLTHDVDACDWHSCGAVVLWCFLWTSIAAFLWTFKEHMYPEHNFHKAVGMHMGWTKVASKSNSKHFARASSKSKVSDQGGNEDPPGLDGDVVGSLAKGSSPTTAKTPLLNLDNTIGSRKRLKKDEEDVLRKIQNELEDDEIGRTEQTVVGHIINEVKDPNLFEDDVNASIVSHLFEPVTETVVSIVTSVMDSLVDGWATARYCATFVYNGFEIDESYIQRYGLDEPVLPDSRLANGLANGRMCNATGNFRGKNAPNGIRNAGGKGGAQQRRIESTRMDTRKDGSAKESLRSRHREDVYRDTERQSRDRSLSIDSTNSSISSLCESERYQFQVQSKMFGSQHREDSSPSPVQQQRPVGPSLAQRRKTEYEEELEQARKAAELSSRRLDEWRRRLNNSEDVPRNINVFSESPDKTLTRTPQQTTTAQKLFEKGRRSADPSRAKHAASSNAHTEAQKGSSKWKGPRRSSKGKLKKGSPTGQKGGEKERIGKGGKTANMTTKTEHFFIGTSSGKDSSSHPSKDIVNISVKTSQKHATVDEFISSVQQNGDAVHKPPLVAPNGQKYSYYNYDNTNYNYDNATTTATWAGATEAGANFGNTGADKRSFENSIVKTPSYFAKMINYVQSKISVSVSAEDHNQITHVDDNRKTRTQEEDALGQTHFPGQPFAYYIDPLSKTSTGFSQPEFNQPVEFSQGFNQSDRFTESPNKWSPTKNLVQGFKRSKPVESDPKFVSRQIASPNGGNIRLSKREKKKTGYIGQFDMEDFAISSNTSISDASISGNSGSGKNLSRYNDDDDVIRLPRRKSSIASISDLGSVMSRSESINGTLRRQHIGTPLSAAHTPLSVNSGASSVNLSYHVGDKVSPTLSQSLTYDDIEPRIDQDIEAPAVFHSPVKHANPSYMKRVIKRKETNSQSNSHSVSEKRTIHSMNQAYSEVTEYGTTGYVGDHSQDFSRDLQEGNDGFTQGMHTSIYSDNQSHSARISTHGAEHDATRQSVNGSIEYNSDHSLHNADYHADQSIHSAEYRGDVSERVSVEPQLLGSPAKENKSRKDILLKRLEDDYI